ncbi:glycosyltransferase family A protein [uncultured Shewanella sp.]|uniref:glycosyltransferase family A protein n=1 Tax=uncultured Shewanella sp. TaxID=173975 RepID=UPI0026288ED9|nr:glycosyltransferase family 2 protein [uncultured Shewanella sp.]
MILNVLISTYGPRIEEVERVLREPNVNVCYTVVHQCSRDDDYVEVINKLTQERDDVSYHSLYNKGLSRNRNKAVSVACGDICLIMDDDVTLVPNFYEIIAQAFREQPEADMISFQISEYDSGKLLKDYPVKAQRHDLKSILKIGSIEMAIRLTSLQKKNITFPEYLGAGTSLPACEEPVFLSRLIKSGAKLFYRPIVIGHHPILSSGKVFDKADTLICRGVAFREIYGSTIGLAAVFYFYFKNRSKFNLVNQSPIMSLLKGYFMSQSDKTNKL